MERDESCEVVFASRRVVDGVIFEALTSDCAQDVTWIWLGLEWLWVYTKRVVLISTNA